jgi:SprT protein
LGDQTPAQLPLLVEDAAAARLEELLGITARRLQGEGVAPMPRPELRFFEHRLDAGRATPPRTPGEAGVLELNGAYLRHHPEAMLHETVAHELAHLVVFHLHPRRRLPPHGDLWQQVMREWFGVEPQRTHRFDADVVRARRQRRWRYACACREHDLTTVRHRRAERGARYLCRACGSTLTAIVEDASA